MGHTTLFEVLLWLDGCNLYIVTVSDVSHVVVMNATVLLAFLNFITIEVPSRYGHLLRVLETFRLKDVVSEIPRVRV